MGRLRVSGTAGSRQGGGVTDGRGPDIAWLWGKKEKEERVEGGREEGRGTGALERRYRYGIMKTRMYF